MRADVELPNRRPVTLEGAAGLSIYRVNILIAIN